MNSLYGRWGLKPSFHEVIFTRDIEIINNIRRNYTVHTEDIFNEDVYYIVYQKIPNNSLKDLYPERYKEFMNLFKKSISTIIFNYPLAAAITAYSRCIIDPFKR